MIMKPVIFFNADGIASTSYLFRRKYLTQPPKIFPEGGFLIEFNDGDASQKREQEIN